MFCYRDDGVPKWIPLSFPTTFTTTRSTPKCIAELTTEAAAARAGRASPRWQEHASVGKQMSSRTVDVVLQHLGEELFQ